MSLAVALGHVMPNGSIPHISHKVCTILDGAMQLCKADALPDFVLKLLHQSTLHSHVPKVWMHHEGLQCALMRHS